MVMFFTAAAAVPSLFLAAIVFLGVVCLLKYQAVAVLRKLPGPKPSFLFGNALQLARLPDEMLKQVEGFTHQYQKEGLICLWLGFTYPLVLLYKPELVEKLLNSSKHISKSPDYAFTHPWLGTASLFELIVYLLFAPSKHYNTVAGIGFVYNQGLLTSDGSKWKTRRKLITPTFHFKILNDFIQVFEEQAAILVTHLEKEVSKGVFDIMPYITVCALDIICITSMDSSPNAQEHNNSPYVKAVVRMSELIQMRQRSPWLWNDLIYSLTPSGKEHNKCLQILHDFTNKVIDERIAERAATKYRTQEEKTKDEKNEDDGLFKRKKRLAFLDLLLEAYDNGEISREGVREEVDTFMFEGHDTTAAGITWALYLLGRHPVIQQKVHEEVDSFFEQRPDTVTVEDMKELRYLECVIKEAQRLFPSVPFLARTTSGDFYFDGGYIAPKGTTVGVATIALHRNPEVWPAPLEFDPDRFLPENSQGRHPFAFIPFSAGPRNCIGQRFALLEEKIVLSHVLRNFDVESTQTFDDLRTCAELITRPKEGIFVTLKKRQ